MRRNVAGVYLAAGRSSRMGAPKLELELEPGRRLGAMALREALASRLRRLIVVTPGDDDKPAPRWLSEAIAHAERHAAGAVVPLEIARCADAAAGMSRSLRCGLARAEATGAEAVVVLLADQPHVRAADIDALLDVFAADAALDFAALSDGGVPKPPLLLAAAMYHALRQLDGDAGARKLLQSGLFHGVLLDAHEDIFFDIDTPEDWHRLFVRGSAPK